MSPLSWLWLNFSYVFYVIFQSSKLKTLTRVVVLNYYTMFVYYTIRKVILSRKMFFNVRNAFSRPLCTYATKRIKCNCHHYVCVSFCSISYNTRGLWRKNTCLWIVSIFWHMIWTDLSINNFWYTNMLGKHPPQ